MGIELTKEALDEMLGPRTDISALNNVQASVTGIAFDLYRETTIAAAFVSHIYESVSDGHAALSRDQAIKAGLGVRIAKYMGAVLALLSDAVREHREVIMTLNRCISESAMNLKFFAEQAQPADYDEFVKSSLRPERDQRTLILRNIEDRGSELPIEKRMLHSIERTLKRSGINDPSELEKI